MKSNSEYIWYKLLKTKGVGPKTIHNIYNNYKIKTGENSEINENIVNDAVSIFRGFLNDSNALIDDPFLFYKGTIDTYGIGESGDTSNVTLRIVSHWADFEKKSGRKTNSTSQQRFFSGDLGMEFSSETVLDIKWGRK